MAASAACAIATLRNGPLGRKVPIASGRCSQRFRKRAFPVSASMRIKNLTYPVMTVPKSFFLLIAYMVFRLSLGVGRTEPVVVVQDRSILVEESWAGLQVVA